VPVIARLCAAAMRAARHQVLIFHRVLAEKDPLLPSEPDARWFAQLVGMLTRHFEVIGLDEAAARVAEGRLSGRSLSITFDDGYADNYEVALPILERAGAPATFFVATGFLDGGTMWNDRIIETVRRLSPGRYAQPLDGDREAMLEIDDLESRRQAIGRLINAWKHLPQPERQARVDAFAALAGDLPDDLMLSTAQLRAMDRSDYARVGAHTVSHPILAVLPAAQAAEEIGAGKRTLEDKLQREVDWFAYPNGKPGRDYRAEHVEQVRQAGFAAAVSTNWGTLDRDSDRFEIPRFTPWSSSLDRFSIDLVRSHYHLL
jgi:peptidoglycan/xylan/chitin deacetylase (PgdA/CDA1 family)